MKVLLTGPFGKIGYRVIETLLARGYKPVCLDLDTPANRKTARDFGSRIDVIWGDITDAATVARAVEGVSAVIHNAAIIPPGTDRNLALSERVNVGGTRHVIAAIKQCSPQPLLVFPSSISIHGNNLPESPFPKRITDRLHAEDNYAAHKIACEKLIEESGIAYVIVRIGACIEGRNTMPAADAKELMGMVFNINANCRVEYIHPADTAMAMVNAINNPDAVGKKFFLGGGKSCQTTWSEFNSLVLEALGCGRFPDSAFGNLGYYTDWMDTEESQRVLKFQKHSLSDYCNELSARYGWAKPLAFLYRPLVRRYLLSHSSHYKS